MVIMALGLEIKLQETFAVIGSEMYVKHDW